MKVFTRQFILTKQESSWKQVFDIDLKADKGQGINVDSSESSDSFRSNKFSSIPTSKPRTGNMSPNNEYSEHEKEEEMEEKYEDVVSDFENDKIKFKKIESKKLKLLKKGLV